MTEVSQKLMVCHPSLYGNIPADMPKPFPKSHRGRAPTRSQLIEEDTVHHEPQQKAGVPRLHAGPQA